MNVVMIIAFMVSDDVAIYVVECLALLFAVVLANKNQLKTHGVNLNSDHRNQDRIILDSLGA